MPLTTINGYRHFYEDVGRGEPLVLLHGIMNSSRYFEGIIPDLAVDFRVIAPHFRGMGRSEHVTAVPPGAWAGDVLALLDALGVVGFHLYGVSLGGIIAMRLAIDCPERIWTLTVDAPVITVAGIPNPTGPRGRQVPKEVADELAAMHGDDWVTVEQNLNRSLHAPGMADHLDLGEAVAGITAPTLVIRGDIDEPFHPLIQAVDLHSALPDSRLWIAPRTRSLMARRRPADSLRVVRDFVAEHSRLTGAAHDRALLARDATAASAVAAALSRYVQAHNVALSRRTAPPVSGPRPPRENEPVPGPPR